MSWYIGIVVWFILAFAFAGIYNVRQYEIVGGKMGLRYQPIMAFLIFLPLIVWAITRTEWIGDTHMYLVTFEKLPNSIWQIPQYVQEFPKDKGFSVLGICIKAVIGGNSRVYIALIAIIQGFIVYQFYRKYSIDFVKSVFVFVMCTDYFSFMQNGIRQFLAVTVTLLAFPFLVDKKYVRYILIILFASTFHQTALIMIPIMFIVQGKPWNKRSLLLLAGALVAIMYIGQFTDILDGMLADTQYKNVVSDWQQWEDDGTNPLRVAVYAVPTVMSLFGLRFIKYEEDPVINLATNMSIVALGIYGISMFTSGIFIGRLPIYASMYSMGILLPWEIENMFTKQSARIVSCVMMVGFFAFYYYQMHFSWGVM